MKPEEIRAAIAQVKEHPAALYEFRKTCAMHFTAALLASPNTRTEKVAGIAVQRADDLIAALALELEPPEPAAEPAPAAEPPPVITPKEWRSPREILVWDEAGVIHWGERGKNGETYATNIDQQARDAIIRQIESGMDSGAVDVHGINYRFSFTP